MRVGEWIILLGSRYSDGLALVAPGLGGSTDGVCSVLTRGRAKSVMTFDSTNLCTMHRRSARHGACLVMT